MQLHLKTTDQLVREFARVLDRPAPISPADDKHLTSCRACLLGARARLATFRRLGNLNSIDRELHADAVQDLFHALDLVWAAQLAVA